MTHDDKEAFKKDLIQLHLSDATQRYLLARVDMIETYVERMNAINYNVPLVYQLEKLLEKEAWAMHAAYVEEQRKRGLPNEVGWMSAR